MHFIIIYAISYMLYYDYYYIFGTTKVKKKLFKIIFFRI